MEFFGASSEYLLLTHLKNTDIEIVNKNNDDTLSVYWNAQKETTLIIDNVIYVLKPNQMVFLTEFHKVDISKVEDINIIRFNRNFYCINNHDSEIGCKGVLFFGASQVPIINLNEENIKKFELLWSVFLAELKNKDEMQIEMLQMLLKRFLIIATRIFKDENKIVYVQETKMDVIRNFSFLVEVHFKTKHTVAEYADLMNKPAKSLTNLFANHIEKSPLQIIQDRIFLEAKRILLNSEKSIKETAFELGFEDIQSFSRFFKNKQGVSPKEFRDNKSVQS
ncbi:helix-turn-helix domain-containing protein [Flavobacterium sp.]|uniref:helix-turn-helix domain-containing protein n=1 Tax=Flavobacterium sp. TaxID=239 RepID=UPI003750E0D0